jgi:hypothetical protein
MLNMLTFSHSAPSFVTCLSTVCRNFSTGGGCKLLRVAGFESANLLPIAAECLSRRLI